MWLDSDRQIHSESESCHHRRLVCIYCHFWLLQPPCKLLRVTSPSVVFKGARVLVQLPIGKVKSKPHCLFKDTMVLCAALQRKYVIRDVEPIAPTADNRKPKPDILIKIYGLCLHVVDSDAESESNFDLESPVRLGRGTIDFAAYTEFKLHPIKDVASCQKQNPMGQPIGLRSSRIIWRTRMIGNCEEGGVLYAAGGIRRLFNCILNYHRHVHKGTGIAEWNTLFPMLQNSGYHKNSIPCMVGTAERL